MGGEGRRAHDSSFVRGECDEESPHHGLMDMRKKRKNHKDAFPTDCNS